MIDFSGVSGPEVRKKLAAAWASFFTAGILGDGDVQLFKNDITPSQLSVYADFTEADFTGYAAVPLGSIGWGGEGLDLDNNAKILANDLAVFTQSGVAVTNTVYGVYFRGPGDYLLGAYRFPTPIEMDADGNVITLELGLQIPSNAGVAGCDVDVSVQ